MTPDEAAAILAQITLPAGFTGTVSTSEDGTVYVDICGPSEWICYFTQPDHLEWARTQIAAATA